jgi:GxxExxY protein
VQRVDEDLGEIRANTAGVALAPRRSMYNRPTPLLLEGLTKIVIGCFYEIYNELGGYPEYILRRGLVVAFSEAGLEVQEEVAIPVWFRGRQLSTFRADLIVNRQLIVEVKASQDIQPFHKAQLMHYLKATDLEVGLLLNFGRKPEFTRVVFENARKRRTPADAPTESPAAGAAGDADSGADFAKP